MRRLDLLSTGRCMVDLYCDQVGGPIEQGQSLSMYVGGCPTNVAVGAARLGLKVGMLTRVGPEGTGRFILETLRREGIETSHVRVDPACKTPMVVVGIEPPDRFPIDWYRERPADLALVQGDFDEALLASTRAVLISGNSLSRETATMLALARLARGTGARVIYDLDVRPVLWGQDPAPALQLLLPHADLLVGTEEEYCALTGLSDPEAAYEAARARTPAMTILKRGPRGADVAWPGAPPIRVAGFPVEVLNTLGAGDAFLAGFLSGWLEDLDPLECARRGNANGALVVSRHGCAPAMPYRAEVERFLETGRIDAEIERLHALGALPPSPRPLHILAMDHRGWFLDQAPPEPVRRFKAAAVRTVRQAAEARGRAEGLGFLLDEPLGAQAFQEARGCWVGQPLERCGADPLEVEGPGGDPGLTLRGRPRDRAVKLLVRLEPAEVRPGRTLTLLGQVQAACEAWGRPLLLEVLPRAGSDLCGAVEALLTHGLRPAWWKLPLPSGEVEAARLFELAAATPGGRGILFLGGDQPLEVLAEAFARLGSSPHAAGFAVGRSVFGDPFRRWLAGEERGALQELERRFTALSGAWPGG